MSLKFMIPLPVTGGTGPSCFLLQSVIRLSPFVGWRASGEAGRKNGWANRARENEVDVFSSLGLAVGLRATRFLLRICLWACAGATSAKQPPRAFTFFATSIFATSIQPPATPLGDCISTAPMLRIAD